MSDAIRNSSGVSFERQSDGNMMIVDLIDRRRCPVEIPESAAIEEADTSTFQVPVDNAIRIVTDTIVGGTTGVIFVRRTDGPLVEKPMRGESVTCDPGEYIIEFCGPVKFYVEASGPFTVTVSEEEAEVQFERTIPIRVGARSMHERPAETVETTDDPHDLMQVVSGFGSALKTLSPERSFPSRRGYPPLIELTDAAPEQPGLEPPCPAIEVVTRPTYHDIYTLSPLVYYLGAEMVPGASPQLRINDSLAVDFQQWDRLSDGVRTVLAHLFTLDCAVRTAGLYQVDIATAEYLEAELDLDKERLYYQPLPERTRSYLQFPFDAVEPVTPDWPFHVHIVESSIPAPLLPHFSYQLATIEVQDPVDALDCVPRDEDGRINLLEHPVCTGVPVENLDLTGREFPREVGWSGPGYVKTTTKVLGEGYTNSLKREPGTEDINVTVVCNDDDFQREYETVRSIYGEESTFPFSVSLRRNLTRDAMATELRGEADFLHYIGHVEEGGGFECADGFLSPEAIDTVGVSMFLLNACNSYRLGHSLVKGGAIAAVSTVGDVMESSAAWFGITLSKLLNLGFPINAALSVLRPESLIGEDYLVIGDGQSNLAQPKSIPALVEIDTTADDLDFTVTLFANDHGRLGTMIIPYVGDNEQYAMVSRHIDWLSPTVEEVNEYLELDQMPVRLNGELTWSRDIVPLSLD